MSARAAERIKQIVDELLATRIVDLKDEAQTQKRLGELQQSLTELEAFAQSIEGLLGRFEIRRGPGRPPGSGTKTGRRVGRKPGRPRGARRGPGTFNATPFILAAVQEGGDSGIRPREIVEKVVTAAPGKHVRPSALVSTILTRLKKKGLVRRRAGKWYTK